jgi:hypothetical protein
MNERITIKISITDRWLDNGEFDERGELIRWPNPDPTVIWNSGCWDKELGQGVMMAMTASKFRELTGHIIYGGDVEARGVHKVTILHGDYSRLRRYREEGVVVRRKRKSKKVVKSRRVLPERDKLKEVMEGRGRQLKGVQCRVRKRK